MASRKRTSGGAKKSAAKPALKKGAPSGATARSRPSSRMPAAEGAAPQAVTLRAPKPTSVYARMGQLVGEDVKSEMDLVVLVTTGLSARSVGTFRKALDLDTALVATETTLRRRLQENRPLSVDESERMIRIARITSLAENLFADQALAHEWLSTPAEFLPGCPSITPMALSATDPGARLVESLILRTEHGLF